MFGISDFFFNRVHDSVLLLSFVPELCFNWRGVRKWWWRRHQSRNVSRCLSAELMRETRKRKTVQSYVTVEFNNNPTRHIIVPPMYLRKM